VRFFGVGVGVGVGIAVSEGVGVGVGEGVEEGVALGAAITVGFFTATPLFQISFFPESTQVYNFPELIRVLFFFMQVAPALRGAAFTGVAIEISIPAISIKVLHLRIVKE
jgi:hypothetical protein